MDVGKKNISFGWLWILVGISVGAIMGLWSFNGPFNSPVGDYTALPRRLLRLSHIAFIALGVINILYGYEISKINLLLRYKQLGSRSAMYGAILMPLLLLAAVFVESFKYLTVIPVILLFIAILVMVVGKYKFPKSRN